MDERDEVKSASGSRPLILGMAAVALSGAVGLWLLIGRRAPNKPTAATSSAPSETARDDSGNQHLAPRQTTSGLSSQPIQRIELSAQPPGAPGQDYRSPTLLSLIELARPTREQEAQIRDAWTKHEEGRRAVLAEPTKSAASPEAYHRDALNRLDGELEIALVFKILEPGQRERVLAAIGHRYQPK